jgi:hypothetical protein
MDITNIKDIDNIIIDYKYQLETQEKFKKCIKDIPKCRTLNDKYQNISSYGHIQDDIIYYYDKINKKYVDYYIENYFRYFNCDVIRHNNNSLFMSYSNISGWCTTIYVKK